MKKILIYIIIFAFAMLSPIMFLENGFVAKADEINNVLNISLDGDNVLSSDKDINSSFDSIGSASNPFTGTFDGQGHKVTIKNCGFNKAQYQGLFGYADGATIKNLKIVCEDLQLDLSAGFDQYVVGMLLGYGNNVTIENCEIEGNVIAKEGTVIQNMTTFGGIAGYLTGGSQVKNCGVYLSAGLDYSLIRTTSLTFGGTIGTLADSSTISYTIAYNEYNLKNVSTLISAEVSIGGIAGKTMGSLTKIVNSATTLIYSVDSDSVVDSVKKGGVTGSITNPVPSDGNLKSIAYYVYDSVNESQITNVYGNSDSVIYNIKNISTQDYVLAVSQGVLRAERFFSDSLYYDEYQLEWELNDWDFASKWIMANNEVRLQQFQTFEIKLADVIDESGLLEKIPGSNKNAYAYDESVQFNLKFADSENDGYFDILDIKKNGTSISFGEFEKEGNIYKDANENYILEKQITEGVTTYVFTVRASNLTEGSYSFVTAAITYDVYVLANEGGKVKTANITSDALDVRALYKNALPYVVTAVPAYQHAFSYWSLWEEISKTDYDANVSDDENYFKYTANNQTTYWNRVSDKSFTTSDLSIALGTQNYKENYFENPQNLLLKANFEEKTYKFSIKDLDITKLFKIEVVSHGGLSVKTFDSNSTNNDYVTIDQNEAITLKIYVKSGWELDENGFEAGIKAIIADKASTTVGDETATLYTVTMSSSNFKNFVNASGQMSIQIKTVESKETEEGGSSIWIWVAIGGGAVLLLAIIIFIIVKKKRGGNNKEEGYDYKKYYN